MSVASGYEDDGRRICIVSNKGGLISKIQPNSLASKAGFQVGDCLVCVNGEPVRDLIDLSFALAEPKVRLAGIRSSGEQFDLTVRKSIDEDLGLEFESAVFDGVRACGNKCMFCFVDQMPGNMRSSLYIKDDDYRLSFLYGNFITLTNWGADEFKRVAQLHLSPLYVSVHCTDGQLRQQLLGTPRAKDIMQQLRELTSAGIEVHAQIVLCPGINDGKVLEKSLKDLASLQPGVLSVAIVPVGLTKFRQFSGEVRGMTQEEAVQLVDQVTVVQRRHRKKTGKAFVYLSDEIYLLAGSSFPTEDWYDDYPQIENGVGMARKFLGEWGYVRLATVKTLKPPYVDIICGTAIAPVLAPLVQSVRTKGFSFRLHPVENEFFGPLVDVSGLLTGADILRSLKTKANDCVGIVLPGTAVRRDNGLFLDEIRVEDIEQELGVKTAVVDKGSEFRRLLEKWGTAE